MKIFSLVLIGLVAFIVNANIYGATIRNYCHDSIKLLLTDITDLKDPKVLYNHVIDKEDSASINLRGVKKLRFEYEILPDGIKRTQVLPKVVGNIIKNSDEYMITYTGVTLIK